MTTAAQETCTPTPTKMRVETTVDNVIQYLLNIRAVTPPQVVQVRDQAITALDYSRKNRNFKVILPKGPGLLVKQAMHVGDGHFRDGIAIEGQVLRAVGTEATLAPLRPYLPEYLFYDELNDIVITRLVHPATTLTKYHLNQGSVKFGIDTGQAVGTYLALTHKHGQNAIRQGVLDFLRPKIPMTIESPLRQSFGPANPGDIKIRDLTLASMHLFEAAPTLREDWGKADGLVHGDARWDNFLLTAGVGPSGGLNLRFIDWESAGIGEAAWDVGYFLFEYVRLWLHFGPNTRDIRTLEELQKNCFFGPDSWHAACTTFWRTYSRKIGLKASERAAVLARIRDYIPYYMLMIAHESAWAWEARPWIIGICFEMAEKARNDPAAFLGETFGIKVEGSA